MIRAEDSVFLKHIPCPDCGSSDANSLYTDGHTYCFSCGAIKQGDGTHRSAPVRRVAGLLDDIEIKGIRSRKITDETAATFGYGVGTYKGQTVHVAPYFSADGVLVAQHLRTKDKDFPWLGEPKDALPFGAHAWPKTGRMLTVTEGELDALSLSQVQGNKWPVVSIGCGAGPQVKKYVAKHLAYFSGFDRVNLMFDMDEPGRDATRHAAEALGPKAHICELPLKDANEMLVAGRAEELINAMWKAKRFTPTGIVSLADLKDEVLKEQPPGMDYGFPRLDALVRGFRRKEVVVVGGATGAGKTDWLFQAVKHAMTTRKEAAGVFFLEDTPRDVVIRFLGKLVESPLYSNEEPLAITAAYERMAEMGLPPLFIYDNAGAASWEDIKERIRYLANAEGVRLIVLDHVTALVADSDDERKELDALMSDISRLAQELDITMLVVSHLATPEKGSHEEGARIMLRHFRGSRAIAFWAHQAFGLERNQQAESEEERTTTFLRCLKNRRYSRAVGQGVYLRYDYETGMLNEVPEPGESPGEGEGLEKDFSETTEADF